MRGFQDMFGHIFCLRAVTQNDMIYIYIYNIIYAPF